MITIERYEHATAKPQSGFVAREDGEPIAVSTTFVGLLTKLILRHDAQRRHIAATALRALDKVPTNTNDHPG